MDLLRLHTNRYGNIDVRRGVPTGLVYLQGANVRLCNSAMIPSVPAMFGFRKALGRFYPDISGVVIAEPDLPLLDEAARRKAIRDDMERERLLKRIRKCRERFESAKLSGLSPDCAFDESAHVKVGETSLAELRSFARTKEDLYRQRLKPWLDFAEAVQQEPVRSEANRRARFRLLLGNPKRSKQKPNPEPAVSSLRATFTLEGIPVRTQHANSAPSVETIEEKTRQIRRLRAKYFGRAWAALSPDRLTVLALRTMRWNGPDFGFFGL